MNLIQQLEQEEIARLTQSASATQPTKKLMQTFLTLKSSSWQNIFRTLRAEAPMVLTAGERDALFLTGVFSYLDKVLSEPIAEILASLALDADIRDALVSGTGRYAPILNFARSTEGESEVELYRHFTMLSISPSAANRAIVEGIIFADESCRED